MKKIVTATGVIGLYSSGLLTVDNDLFFADAIEKITQQMEIEDCHRFAGCVTVTIEDLTEEMTVNDAV